MNNHKTKHNASIHLICVVNPILVNENNNTPKRNYFISSVILDLDPCRDIICKYHSYCKAYTPSKFDCICEENCPSYEEQVCGSDGHTFGNLCLLQKDICTRRANFTKYHPGSCTGNGHCFVLFVVLEA